MRKYFCMDCDNMWNDLDHAGCPKCGSKDVIDDGEVEPSEWEHGHFEGDLFSTKGNLGYHQDDAGE